MVVEQEQILTDWTIYGYTGDTPIPAMPSQMYDSLNATFPGHSFLDEIETAGDVPTGMLWWLIPGVIVLMLAMIIFDKTKSLAAQVIFLLVCMVFLSLAHVWALWMIIPLGLIAGACLIQNKVLAI